MNMATPMVTGIIAGADRQNGQQQHGHEEAQQRQDTPGRLSLHKLAAQKATRSTRFGRLPMGKRRDVHQVAGELIETAGRAEYGLQRHFRVAMRAAVRRGRRLFRVLVGGYVERRGCMLIGCAYQKRFTAFAAGHTSARQIVGRGIPLTAAALQLDRHCAVPGSYRGCLRVRCRPDRRLSLRESSAAQREARGDFILEPS